MNLQEALLEIAIEAGTGERLCKLWKATAAATAVEVGDLFESIRKKATAALNGEQPRRPGRPRGSRTKKDTVTVQAITHHPPLDAGQQADLLKEGS